MPNLILRTIRTFIRKHLQNGHSLRSKIISIFRIINRIILDYSIPILTLALVYYTWKLADATISMEKTNEIIAKANERAATAGEESARIMQLTMERAETFQKIQMRPDVGYENVEPAELIVGKEFRTSVSLKNSGASAARNFSSRSISGAIEKSRVDSFFNQELHPISTNNIFPRGTTITVPLAIQSPAPEPIVKEILSGVQVICSIVAVEYFDAWGQNYQDVFRFVYSPGSNNFSFYLPSSQSQQHFKIQKKHKLP